MNSLVNNEKQSHCIYHTHPHIRKITNSHIHTQETELSLSLQLCAKNIKEQPELHQLTTKQQRNILSNRKNHTAVNGSKKQT